MPDSATPYGLESFIADCRQAAAGCPEASSLEKAELIVINTCAIREGAEQKVIGRQGQLARLKIDTRAGFVFLSSRASYELVRKAARVGIPMVATISAPTSLAINIAQQAGIRLLGFCRENGFVEYTVPITESASTLAPAMACGPSR